jgi:hypothetical protein
MEFLGVPAEFVASYVLKSQTALEVFKDTYSPSYVVIPQTTFSESYVRASEVDGTAVIDKDTKAKVRDVYFVEDTAKTPTCIKAYRLEDVQPAMQQYAERNQKLKEHNIPKPPDTVNGYTTEQFDAYVRFHLYVRQNDLTINPKITPPYNVLPATFLNASLLPKLPCAHKDPLYGTYYYPQQIDIEQLLQDSNLLYVYLDRVRGESRNFPMLLPFTILRFSGSQHQTAVFAYLCAMHPTIAKHELLNVIPTSSK